MPEIPLKTADIFRGQLLGWHADHHRPMPWKNERNPYLIWLSEIILQQTRVDQGLPYYLRFSSLYPTISDLAAAGEDDILKNWEGLGYYSRARNLHKAAKQVVSLYGGVFPDRYADILALPGVGPYTAAAIVSFAYNLPYPVLDGNVYRVLARFFGEYTPIDSPGARQVFSALAEQVLDRNQPGAFNQAIMDFGAGVCTPVAPACPDCPLRENCHAFRQNTTSILPVKSKKQDKKTRFFHYLIIRTGDDVFIQQRTGQDIWQHLYEFPMIEADRLLAADELPDTETWKKWFGDIHPSIKGVSGMFRQTLTHRYIIARFYYLELSAEWLPQNGAKWRKMAPEHTKKYAFPRIITLFLAEKNIPLSLF